LRLEPLSDLEAVREEWNTLASASRNIFATWEWVSTWWRHFGRNRPIVAFGCRAPDGRLAAILPLYLFSRRLGIVRFIGHDASDELGPICAPEHTLAAARAMENALVDASFRWHLFVGDWLPGKQPWKDAVGGRVVRWEGSPLLRLNAASWDELSGRWSRQERKALRRRERNLRSEHAVSFRRTEKLDGLSDDLDALFALHTSRWSQGSTFARHEAFHREFAHCALERGWLRLWFLEVDGHSVATQYGFRYGGVESVYQSGWDRAWARFSPASLLCVHTIREAFEDGLLEYRFLRGDEKYKYTYADVDDGIETIAVVKGAFGRALLATALAAKRLRLL
jgi:CelD/BcsL family acetyltransferase involved in cellulose biosynthesis